MKKSKNQKKKKNKHKKKKKKTKKQIKRMHMNQKLPKNLMFQQQSLIKPRL